MPERAPFCSESTSGNEVAETISKKPRRAETSESQGNDPLWLWANASDKKATEPEPSVGDMITSEEETEEIAEPHLVSDDEAFYSLKFLLNVKSGTFHLPNELDPKASACRHGA